MFLIHTDRKKGVQASGVLFGYWLLCLLLPATSATQQALRGVSGGPGPPGETNMALSSVGPILPPSLSSHDLFSTQRHTHHSRLNSSNTQMRSLTQKYPLSVLWIQIPLVLHIHIAHVTCTPVTHLYAPIHASHNHRLQNITHTHAHLHTSTHAPCHPVVAMPSSSHVT